jgi:hypothetical protein
MIRVTQESHHFHFRVTGHVAGSPAFRGSRGLVARLDQYVAVFVGDYSAKGHVPTFDSILAQADSCTKAAFVVGSYRHLGIVKNYSEVSPVCW